MTRKKSCSFLNYQNTSSNSVCTFFIPKNDIVAWRYSINPNLFSSNLLSYICYISENLTSPSIILERDDWLTPSLENQVLYLVLLYVQGALTHLYSNLLSKRGQDVLDIQYVSFVHIWKTTFLIQNKHKFSLILILFCNQEVLSIFVYNFSCKMEH